MNPLPTDKLLTQQSVIAYIVLTIVAATVGHTLYTGDVQLRSQVLGAVLGIGGAVVGYYFGSSKGSQDKDARAPTTAAAVEPAKATTTNP